MPEPWISGQCFDDVCDECTHEDCHCGCHDELESGGASTAEEAYRDWRNAGFP